MHSVSRESVRALTVCNGIATATDRRIEHATTGDRASTPGCDCFEAPAGGIEAVRRGCGRKEICSVREVCSLWGAGEIRVQVAPSARRHRRQRPSAATVEATLFFARWNTLLICPVTRWWSIRRTYKLLRRLRHTYTRCVIGGSVPMHLGCTGGRVMLCLCRAVGQIRGVTSAEVCVLF